MRRGGPTRLPLIMRSCSIPKLFNLYMDSTILMPPSRVYNSSTVFIIVFIVNTKALVRFNVAEADWLSDRIKDRLNRLVNIQLLITINNYYYIANSTRRRLIKLVK